MSLNETTTQEQEESRLGHCYGGPCDGQEFQHLPSMTRVKIRDRGKPPGQHIYVWNEGLSQQQGKRVYLWEKMEAWKVGG